MRVRVDEGVRGLYDFVEHRRFEGYNPTDEGGCGGGHVIKTCPEVGVTGPSVSQPHCAGCGPCSLSPMSAVRTNANRAAARKKKFSPYARVV